MFGFDMSPTTSTASSTETSDLIPDSDAIKQDLLRLGVIFVEDPGELPMPSLRQRAA
jgi:hypothetical protein